MRTAQVVLDYEADHLRQDHDELRREIHRLDDALEALELRGELAGLGEFLLRFTMWCSEHFDREEHYSTCHASSSDPEGTLAMLAVDRKRVATQIDQLKAHLRRARDLSARDELWIEAQHFRASLACHFCRADHN